MKLCKCPSCSAELSFSDDREYGFCEYCGSRLKLTDSYVKYEKVNRKIDEARIVEAQIELEKLKLEAEKKKQHEQKILAQRTEAKYCSLISFVFLLIEFTLADTFERSNISTALSFAQFATLIFFAISLWTYFKSFRNT